QFAGSQARGGFIPFLLFKGLLSINLAVLNLLPIPILDGGHLFFYIIEAVTGREINIKWRERAQQIGFIFMILLMLFVFVMDLERLNIKFLHDISNFFLR
ncbi:MAG: site-2 protease family protein, partial [Syntrophales bacterium LBB04]|nr:site-2 protease family protein [Syntrophales bacterium LBB04]